MCIIIIYDICIYEVLRSFQKQQVVSEFNSQRVKGSYRATEQDIKSGDSPAASDDQHINISTFSPQVSKPLNSTD